MTFGDCLTGAGLIVDMVGVLVLWFFGPPLGIYLDGGREVVYTEGTEDSKRKAKGEKRISQIGLALLFLGFGMQLAGNYLSSST